MGRLAVVLGSNAIGPGSERLPAAVAGHDVEVLQRARRRDPGDYVPPHRIDHAANLRSLQAAGCDRVLAVCSVGSLKEEIAVGTLVCPDDFIALQLGITTFDDARGHIAPRLDREWRERVLAASTQDGAAPSRTAASTGRRSGRASRRRPRSGCSRRSATWSG